MKRVHLIISGRVQGVGYRYFVREKADQCNIKGWVKNNIGGTVEVVAEGDDKDIQTFVDYCRKGPSLSLIENVNINYEDPTKEFHGFEIRF